MTAGPAGEFSLFAAHTDAINHRLLITEYDSNLRTLMTDYKHLN